MNQRPIDTQIRTMEYEMENHPEYVTLDEVTDLIRDVGESNMYDKANVLMKLAEYEKNKKT